MAQDRSSVPRGTQKVPDVGIGKLLRRAHNAFKRELRLELQTHEITFGEFNHLEKLWTEDGLNQQEISRRAGIEAASSTKILGVLEKRGLIKRVRNGSDRRNVNVYLTKRGAAIEDKLLTCAAAVNAVARQGLADEDVLRFFSLMNVIIENLGDGAGKQKKAAKRKTSPKREIAE